MMMSPTCGASARSDAAHGEMAGWVAQMKHAPKGPFERIRWFCNDGSVLAPEPFACRRHGGGIQHGEWSEHALRLRRAGYRVANVLAELHGQDFQSVDGLWALKQLLLERFLIRIDDGWIFRKARHYRGALQAEDEAAGARRILEHLAARPPDTKQPYLILRTATSLLPYNEAPDRIAQVRRLSTEVGENDPGADFLRIKIHNQPDAGDARRVRHYARTRGQPALQGQYENLARAIDALYQHEEIAPPLNRLSSRIQVAPLSRALAQAASVYATHLDAETRFRTCAHLLARIRREFPAVSDSSHRLRLLELSLRLEREVFTYGSELAEAQSSATRRQRLYWLMDALAALYGTGAITQRQLEDAQGSLNRIQQPGLTLGEYREALGYLQRVTGWTDRWYRFHFQKAVEHIATIEPKVEQFVPEQLRSSPLLFFVTILDELAKDADRAAGIENRLFGRSVGTGLRGLNAGLARGLLRTSELGPGGDHTSEIAVLPETTPQLPPVAGILTLGEGNALSHVQLLAANLGVPNVAVSDLLAPDIQRQSGKPVVVAVSPRGVVHIEHDAPRWDPLFVRRKPKEHIRADVDKLDLEQKGMQALQDLRATDAGRVVGPKAANLGELKHAFPGHVADGVVIPFGRFRQILEQPINEVDVSAYRWLQDRYRHIRALAPYPQAQEQLRDDTLSRFRQWLGQVKLGEKFRAELRQALRDTFGDDERVFVFVRSDTNMEDLPDFTGAGLNRTEPNVTGFENILSAIRRVWASPFSKRAYAWRQRRMENPEHVYPSVLLMRSVNVDASGVLITTDLEHDRPDWYTVAVSEGVGGAVRGEAAEELRVHISTGETRILAEYTAPMKSVLSNQGGIDRRPVSNLDAVLSQRQLDEVVDYARRIRPLFSSPTGEGQAPELDIEFGFRGEHLVLFQARPYVRDRAVEAEQTLLEMDRALRIHDQDPVDLDLQPGG